MSTIQPHPVTGTTLVARGLGYIPPSADLLKHLSMTVMMGPTPRPILSAHQPRLRWSSHATITNCPLAALFNRRPK